MKCGGQRQVSFLFLVKSPSAAARARAASQEKEEEEGGKKKRENKVSAEEPLPNPQCETHAFSLSLIPLSLFPAVAAAG